MITFKLLPQITDEKLIVEAKNNLQTIILNGDEIDLSDFPNDASVEHVTDIHPFLGGAIGNDIERDTNGNFTVYIRLPVVRCDEPHTSFPEPILVNSDGPVSLPFSTFTETVDDDSNKQFINTTYSWNKEPIVTKVPYPAPSMETAP